MKDLTPKHLRCIPCSCPAVHEVDDGNLLIIGKKASAELLTEIEGRVGDDEYAIVISAEYFAEMNKSA